MSFRPLFRPSRRYLIKLLSSLSLSGAASFSSLAANSKRVAESTFQLLPLGSVRPSGWLKNQLLLQAESLSGHLDETWAVVGPTSGWLGGDGEAWERGPYYLDGLIPLAYLLNSERLKTKAQLFIEWTLQSQTSSGMFGSEKNDDWWPRMVMLKALTQYHEATGDSRVLPFMTRYFHYHLESLPSRPLSSWGKFRWQDEVLTILWLYDRTADPQLLQLATLLHQQGFDWISHFQHFTYTDRMTTDRMKTLATMPGYQDVRMVAHGVNNGQALKTGSVWSRITGADSDRQAVRKTIAMLDKYHGLPNGMFSCDEHLAGRNPSQGSELCTVVEYMFSLEQALAILGDASFGDRLEKLAFNALPGTMTDDMWAHQYDQQPNQIECSLRPRPWTTNGPESNLFGLEPNVGCCTANFSQGWPKFASSLFMKMGEHGIVAAAYSPCEARISLQGTEINVVEETEYPFRDTVRITVNPSKPIRFSFLLRVPAWTQDATVLINGRVQTLRSGEFFRLRREWKQGDIISLKFPMQPKAIRGFHNSVSIERGPLVFAYNIHQDWQKLRNRGMTADWEVHPTSRWNYALSPDSLQRIPVTEAPVHDKPFASAESPITLHVRARALPSWTEKDRTASTLPESPVQSSEVEEVIALIPYAAAKLRISAFPVNNGERPHSA